MFGTIIISEQIIMNHITIIPTTLSGTAATRWLRPLILLLFMAIATQGHAQGDAVLGAGDVLRITVYGQDDLETVARVTQEGHISFPLIGKVTIAGDSNRQADAKIERRLSDGKFVRNPQVSIFVEERVRAEGEVVTIIGQVKKPGRFAVDSLSNDGAQSIVGVLALAGGLGEDAADHLILAKNTADGVKNIRVDLVGLLRDGDLKQNVDLAGGDIVLVPTMDTIFVYGEVQKPGRYRLDRGMTVMQAISVSGGLTSRGTEKGLSVRRRDENGVIVSIKSELNGPLMPNDVVVVGESLF